MSQKKAIEIKGVQLVKNEINQELSATVDGERIWFRFPLFLDLEPRAEIFIPPAMVESMVRGIPIRIDDNIAISEKLARNFEEIQSLFKSWNDQFTISPLIAKTRKDYSPTDMVISCYSGGIDSTYTFGKYKDHISHILLMQGFDDWEEGKGWEQNVADKKAFAESQGKTLITVETNVRHFCDDRKFEYIVLFGSVLAAVGITLNPKQFYIPSSHPYTLLHPSGSHPLLDPLWRTEATEIIHHGCAANRCDKTEFIAQHQDLLDQLQVCWKSSSSNCGTCPKCIRTSAALKILGKESATLPTLEEKEYFDLMVIKEENAFTFFTELALLAKKKGKHAFQRHFEKNIRQYKFKRFFHNFLRFLLGKLGQKLSRRFSHNDWYNRRATIIPNKVK